MTTDHDDQSISPPPLPDWAQVNTPPGTPLEPLEPLLPDTGATSARRRIVGTGTVTGRLTPTPDPPLQRIPAVDGQATPFSIDRAQLAQLVVAHTSGIRGALPEQDDFDRADEMIALLERRLADDREPPIELDATDAPRHVDPHRVRKVPVDAAELLEEAARLITVAIASEPRDPAAAELAFHEWLRDGESWLRRFHRDVAR